MNKIDIFQTQDFVSLPEEKKTEVLKNYFNKNMADDSFKSLEVEKQNSILNNFINSQISLDNVQGKESVQNVKAPAAPIPNFEPQEEKTFWDKTKDLYKKGKNNLDSAVKEINTFFKTGLDGIETGINTSNPLASYTGDLDIVTDSEGKKNYDKGKVDNSVIQDLEALSKIDVGLINDNPEKKEKFYDTMGNILNKRGYDLGQKEDGNLVAIDKQGNELAIKNDFWESLLDGIKSDIGELGGAVGGMATGMKLAKNVPNPYLKAGLVAGGSLVGAVAGNSLDMTINSLKDREKLDWDEIGNELGKSAALDLAGNTAAAGLVKVGGKVLEVPGIVRDYVVNGNLQGARKILKEDLKVDEEYIDDAMEQMKSIYKESNNYSKNIAPEDSNIVSKAISKIGGNIRNQAGQQEELLATVLAKGDENIIKGALDKNETAARNLASMVDNRAKQVIDNLEENSSLVGGKEVNDYINEFKIDTKSAFNNMRENFKNAFKEVDYKFELEDLGLNSVFKDMSKRVQDPDAKKRFETLQKSIKNIIYNSNAQVGIERDIDGLLDLRQQLNRFFGRNEKYIENKPDLDTFASLKEKLDNQIYKAVNDNLPQDLGTRLMDDFSRSMGKYRELGQLEDNPVFKGITAKAKDSQYRMANLVKHMADDDSYVDDVLSKMTPNARQTVEIAVIKEITSSKKFLKKGADETSAIAFEDLGKQLSNIKHNVRSELGKETIDNLIAYGEKFGNRDVVFLDAAKGIVTKKPTNIATTVEGKSRMMIAGTIFDYIQTLKPTKTGQRLALQRHIGIALEKSRTPNEFATRLYKYPDLSDTSKQTLKVLIKNNNKVLAAQNDEEAKRVLKEVEEQNQRILEKETKFAEEVENFQTPDIYEIKTVTGLTPDDRFGSFSQMTTKIQNGTATQAEIEQYLKAKNKIEPEALEKNILKLKYPENAFSVHKLNDLKSFVNEKVNEIISENEFKALIYNLDKYNKLPNTTKEIESKYRDKFYKLNKLYDEEKQLLKEQEKNSFEEADKIGLIPFANGETLGGAFFGGSEASFNERDYNNDGVNNIEDIAIGAIGGAIGFKALSKMFPNWFKNDEIGINANKLNKEKKNILKVAQGEKPSTVLRKYDENEIINLSKGYHSDNENKGAGMHHIIVRHMKDDSNGKISLEELTQIGEVIRNGELTINNNKRVYTLNKNDVRFRAITGENENAEKVISFYSNRNINTGTEHDARNYTLSTSVDDGVIITYKPQKNFKEWAESLKKNDDGVVLGSFSGKSPIIEKDFKDSQGFYSLLEKTIDEKVGGKIDSVSLTKMLEKNGVKQDEIEWSGLKDLLDEKEKVTKKEIEETLAENRLILEKVEKRENPKYSDYKIDGGENYREILFKTPNEISKGYKSKHWDESNIVVFTRVDDRKIDDKKTLFIEELQSDWHQEGRKKGYGKKIPDAPFKKNWSELGLKRMIQEAVENDYEKIAWTTGKQQTQRYSLEKEIDTVIYNKESGYLQASKDGDEVIFKKVANDEEVSTLLGKELTTRLIDPKHSTRDNIFVIKGEETKFGGDGMKTFYDEIVPNTAKKLLKKYNVKPKLEELDEIEEMVWSIEITPKMKEDIKKYGQPLYAVAPTIIGNELINGEIND